MSSQTLLYLVPGVAVLGLLVYRQLVAQPVQGTNSGGNGVVRDSRILAGRS